MFYFFISKKHLYKKKIVLLIISGLLFTLIITVPVTYIYIYLLFEKTFDLSGKKFLLTFGIYYLRIFEVNFMFAVSGSLLKIALLYYENIMKQKEAEKQLVAGELALLRSQINPHFLLNTLTNIKALIEKAPDKAIYSIENLSELMSYMLYETSTDKVSLENEINYINNYLNLQKVRFCPAYIDFEITGDANGILVPPLLFMPFLENVFKFADGISDAPGIIINLNIRDNNLSFKTMNYFRENTNKSERGFSVNSIKRFLDIQFGNNYTLEIKKQDNKYLATLNVNLS